MDLSNLTPEQQDRLAELFAENGTSLERSDLVKQQMEQAAAIRNTLGHAYGALGGIGNGITNALSMVAQKRAQDQQAKLIGQGGENARELARLIRLSYQMKPQISPMPDGGVSQPQGGAGEPLGGGPMNMEPMY